MGIAIGRQALQMKSDAFPWDASCPRKRIAELDRIQEENRMLDQEELEMFGDTERVRDELLSCYDREPQLVDWENGGGTPGYVSEMYDMYDYQDEAA